MENCKLENGYTCTQRVVDAMVPMFGGRASKNIVTGELYIDTRTTNELNASELDVNIEQLKQICGNTACKYNIDYKEN